jgi:uncharacterized metal-binding protein
MAADCTHCNTYVCRLGRTEGGGEACPMAGPFPDFDWLYEDAEDRRQALVAARIEAEGYGHWTRVEETRTFIHRMGWLRVGIAHGRDTGREAHRFADLLARDGVEAVLPWEGEPEDPGAQARRFAHAGTDLNVVLGLPVADEVVLLAASHAPVTVLVARDVRLRHNPAAALYISRSYLHDSLHAESNRFRPLPDGADRPASAELSRGMTEWERERIKAGRPPCRLEEVMVFAGRLGAGHIGISFCVGLREEAAVLGRILEANGFQVTGICCKSGAVPKERLGLTDAEKVRPGTAESICNSHAQAELLRREGVDLAVVLGQCVGHDAATLGRLGLPACVLAAKDRVLAHNTAAALPPTTQEEGRRAR